MRRVSLPRGEVREQAGQSAALELLFVGGFVESDWFGECKRILGSARYVNISYEWVRGHNGHPLNELADRLAVLARRNREMDVDELANARMIA